MPARVAGAPAGVYAPSMKRVQSVRFSKTESPAIVNYGRGWRPVDAMRWLHMNGFAGLIALETPGQWRFRQLEPDQPDPESFRTVTEDLPRGVQAVTADL